MRRKTVVTTGPGVIILPESPRSIDHVKKIVVRFTKQLLAQAVPTEQLEAKIVANERIGRMDIAMRIAFTTLRTELITQHVPQLRICPGRGDIEVKGVILANFSMVGGNTELAVLANGIVDKKTAIERLSANSITDTLRQLDQTAITVKKPRSGQHRRIEHIAGIVDVLNEFVGL